MLHIEFKFFSTKSNNYTGRILVNTFDLFFFYKTITRVTTYFRESGSCSHITGLLIALQNWLLMGFVTIPDDLPCTSLPQLWSVPRGNKLETAAVPHMCIVKPHPDRKQKPVANVLIECRYLYVLALF